MKTLVLWTMFISAPFQAMSFISTPTPSKDYKFHFKLGQEKLEISQSGPSYEVAFERAAQSCFNHFKNGQKLTEDRGLDIIDVCANPRSM